MLSLIWPVDQVDEAHTEKGLRSLLMDGLFAQTMGVLIGGAFLVAFALQLGASNKVIGLLGAISPLAQLVQIPATMLIERFPYRKLLVLITVLIGRGFWLLIAIIPWITPKPFWIPAFLISQFIYYGVSAIAGCAWNSWIRDFVPEKVMGGYFAKRASWATAIGAGVSVLAAVLVDVFKKGGFPEIAIYSAVLGIGAVFGLVGTMFLALTPEPRMKPSPKASIIAILAEPFRDTNFRMLLIFLAWWSFAMNISGPFFTVFMLKQLKMSMGWVMGLSVVSQVFNVIFFRIWGRLADRFTNKSCLMASGTMFVFSLAMWPFMTMPEKTILTIPLLISFHVLAGISTAGIGLCAGNLALKAAPFGRATAYLAVNALVSGGVATIAPIISGAVADWLETQRLKLTFTWVTGLREFHLPAVDIQGLDFLFIASFLLGLYAMHRLLPVREEGEVEEAVVREQLLLEVRKTVKHISNVAGIRQITHFPFMVLRYVRHT